MPRRGLHGTASLAATATEQAILERLAQLESNQRRLEAELEKRDARIEELEQRLEPGKSSSGQLQELAVESSPGATSSQAIVGPATTAVADTVAAADTMLDDIGRFNPGGRGYTIADTPEGTINFSAWAYVRYLNQKALDKNYTDSFGRTYELDLRNDMQVNKVNLDVQRLVIRP